MQPSASSSRACRVTLVLAAAVGAFSLAPPARACSYIDVAIETSYPAWGAANVPTNVVLYVAGKLVVPDVLSLESATGERVPITVSRVVPTGFDITPDVELEPNQRYSLLHPNIDLIGPPSLSIEFETGSGPAAPAVLPPPDLALAVLLGSNVTSCSSSRLCLEPGSPDTALFAAHPEILLSERQAPGTLGGAYNRAYVPEDCLQVWRRDALGNHSEVVALCGTEVPSFELTADTGFPSCEEFRHGLLAVAGTAPDADVIDPAIADATGCSLAAPGARASFGAFLGAVLALLAAVGTRRRLLSARPGR